MPETDETGPDFGPEIEAELPDGELSSLRRIQYVYGLLNEREAALDHPHAAYLTPEEFESEFDGGDDPARAESVLVCRVDLTDPDEPRLDPSRPFEAVRYRPGLAADVAHSHNSAARGLDYSITHKTGASSGTGTIAKYLRQRFTRWPTFEPIDDFAHGARTEDPGRDEESRPGGVEVIDGLARLGADESAMERVTEWVERIEPEPPVLVTVRIRRETDGEYEWPGRIGVLNRAMRYYRVRDYVESRQHGSESSGSGRDYVTGTDGPLVGGAKDPLNLYRVKQRERFPGLDYRDAWRSHPVGPDTALRIESAERFLDACYTTQAGLRVYYLPYLTGDIDADDLEALHAWLTDLEASSEGQTVVDRLVERRETSDGDGPFERLRLYAIVLQAYQNQRYRVYGEAPEADVRRHAELARIHEDVLSGSEGWLFGDDEPAAFPALENGFESTDVADDGYPYPLVDRGMDVHDRIDRVASGAYFAETLPTPGDEPSPDDPWVAATLDLVREGRIDERSLLDGYARRLADEARTNPDFFRYTAAQQVAQLRALSAAGCLDGAAYHPADPRLDAAATGPDDSTTTGTDEGAATVDGTADEQLSLGAFGSPDAPGDATTPTATTDRTMVDLTETDDDVSRGEKLDAYLDEAPYLSLETNPERRAAFLVGALVGRISTYQTNRLGVSQTLRRQYPVGKLSAARAEDLVAAVVDRDSVYAEDDGRIILYESYVTRLVEALGRCSADWASELPETTLRHDYGIGMAYGLTDRTKKNPDRGDGSDQPAEDDDAPEFA